MLIIELYFSTYTMLILVFNLNTQKGGVGFVKEIDELEPSCM